MLSFPLGEDGEYDIDEDNGCKMLGDIVISMERALEQADLYGHRAAAGSCFLTVHSMLHLLGYDHERRPGSYTDAGKRRSCADAAGPAPHGELHRMICL